jgi:hypothetical protein
MFDVRSRRRWPDPLHESDDLFVEMVGRATAVGITEISIYYPALESQLPAFERIATECSRSCGDGMRNRCSTISRNAPPPSPARVVQSSV